MGTTPASHLQARAATTAERTFIATGAHGGKGPWKEPSALTIPSSTSRLVHRALHYRKTPKRTRGAATRRKFVGMAAGILAVRPQGHGSVCDIATLEGKRDSKTLRQLKATYDAKGPIKGRTSEEATCQEE